MPKMFDHCKNPYEERLIEVAIRWRIENDSNPYLSNLAMELCSAINDVMILRSRPIRSAPDLKPETPDVVP